MKKPKSITLEEAQGVMRLSSKLLNILILDDDGLPKISEGKGGRVWVCNDNHIAINFLHITSLAVYMRTYLHSLDETFPQHPPELGYKEAVEILREAHNGCRSIKGKDVILDGEIQLEEIQAIVRVIMEEYIWKGNESSVDVDRIELPVENTEVDQ